MMTIAPKNELPARPCKECGEAFRQKRVDQVFCDRACNRRYFRRKEIRGAQVLEMLMEWRRFRGGKGTPGEGKLSDIANIVDGFLREDREQGRG